MRYNLISYLIGDGIKNISKNKKSTITAITIMVVTMLTVGICFIIGQNLKAILGKMEKGYPIQVYMIDGTTEAQKNKLENDIKNIQYVNPDNIQYISKKDAYYESIKKLGENSVQLQGYTEDAHPFPASFVITLTDLEKLNEVVDQIETLDNVKGTSERTADLENDKTKVSQPEEKKSTAETLTHLNRNVNIVLLAIGGVLVIFSIIIIGNTIKLTVHARRKEISIMKYVGATNSFIRAPFIVEGIVIGIISSSISLVLLGGLYVWIKRSLIENSLQTWLQKLGVNSGIDGLLSFGQMFTQILLIFLAIGIGIGVFGSARSMRKYLKV